jgi:hypothetical protein
MTENPGPGFNFDQALLSWRQNYLARKEKSCECLQMAAAKPAARCEDWVPDLG